MRIRVLGCFGGSAPDMRPTSFLVNNSIAVDAGAITSSLSLQEQSQIRHIFISHSHVDHLATLPFLLDNLFSGLEAPVELYGPGHTIDCLKKHFFNDHLWPDFTHFSNDRSAILTLNAIQPGQSIQLDGIRITPAPMRHTVPCYGYLLEDEDASGFICGDTDSIDDALPILKRTKDLQIVVLEASFPRRMQKIADLSRHLTTRTFCSEVQKIPHGPRILVTHMKPDCLGEIQIEIADLALDHVSLLEQGATYNIGPVPLDASTATK